MSIARVPGFSLLSNLDRQGIDLEFSTNSQTLTYMDFANFRLGINTASPSQSLEVVGNVLVTNGHIFSSANVSYDIGSSSNWFRNIYANSVISTSLTGTIQTVNQPNITGLGNLNNLTVLGNISAGNISSLGTIAITGNLSVDNLTANTYTGNIVTAVQPFITNLANITLDNLTSTGNITANLLVANQANIGDIYGTIRTGNQPHISNLGNISVESITIGGNITITGNTVSETINADEIYENGFRVLTANSNIVVTGDVLGSGTFNNVAVSLSNVGVIAGLYGSTDNIPSIVVDSKGRITSAANVVLTKVGNITVTDTTISTIGNLILSPSSNIVDAGNSRISNIAVPVESSDAVTKGYLEDALIFAANILAAGDSTVTLTDNVIANLAVVLDGTLTSVQTANSTTFYQAVTVDEITIENNTISSAGNIILDALGEGIVQIAGSDALGIPAGGVGTRPGSPMIGYTRFNTDTKVIETWDGYTWNSPGISTVTSETIVPDGVSNVFILSTNASSAYGLLVSINGTLQQPVTSYDVDGNQLIFTEIPQDTDVVEVRSIAAGIVVSALQLGTTEVDLSAGNVNIAGNLIPQADVTYDIGSSDLQWRDLFLSGNTIHLGGATLSTDGNTLIFTPAGSQTAVNLGQSAYTDANVTAYLPSHTGNISAGNINANLVFVGGESVTGLISTANTNMKGYVDGEISTTTSAISTANTAMQGYVDAANTIQSNQITAVSNSVIGANSAIATANTNMKGYVDGQITSLIGGSPETLDTLNEIAAALGNDANLSVTLTNQIAGVQANVTAANSAIVTANTNMKGYVDNINSILTSNAAAQAGSISALELSKANLSGAAFTGTISAPSLTLSSTALAITSGGTGSTSSSGALDNLLPAGEISGYVLSTSGPGSYYWAEPTGGGGTTVGSQISISRTTYTATAGQTVFTNTGTYTIGSNQLRVFINGVRQFPSEYTETSSTSFTVTPGLAVGDLVMAEVDSFQNYTIFANAVVSSAVGGVSATNVQNAIAELDTEKASLSGAVFTGNLTGTNLVSSFGLWGTIRTAAQTNITSVGTLGSLAVTGNITAGNVSATNLSGAITSSQVTTALGFTPYNATNPSGFTTNTGTVTRIQGNGAVSGLTLTGDVTSSGNIVLGGTLSLTSGQVTGALGFTPYNATNPSGFTTNTGTVTRIRGNGTVSGLTLTGDVTTNGNVVLGGTLSLTSGQVTTALGFTPYNATNPSGFTTNTGTVTSISGTGTVSGLTLSGTVTGSGSLTLGGTLSLSSGQVTGALGFTPYNATNPSGFISAVPNASTQVTSLGVGTAASGVTGEIRATNNITAFFSSDARLKENVREIPNALDKVSAIGGKLFAWTDEYISSHGGLDDYFLTKESFGVIAQDVEQVFPEAVRTREDGYLAVDYERMCALAFQAIKELQQQVQLLEQQIKDK